MSSLSSALSAFHSRQIHRICRVALFFAIATSVVLISADSALAASAYLGAAPTVQPSRKIEVTASIESEPVSGPVNESVSEPASEPVAIASLFTKHCAGCHAHGGNVVRRGKTLKQKALKRYGYDNVTRISQIITNGKGVMSSYRDRLSAEEIEAIAQYVLSQAETDWQ